MKQLCYTYILAVAEIVGSVRRKVREIFKPLVGEMCVLTEVARALVGVISHT